jgi:hypothetical protein
MDLVFKYLIKKLNTNTATPLSLKHVKVGRFTSKPGIQDVYMG